MLVLPEKLKMRIVKVEERRKDSWVDMSLRAMREGEVRFYSVDDPLTGKWLFKVCSDSKVKRVTVKALKCPPGSGFAQLEGSTILFQPSLLGNNLYAVASSTYMDGEGRLRKRVIDKIEDIPEPARQWLKIIPYEEATGKKAAGKGLVILCDEKDEKSMIITFILLRSWTLTEVPPDVEFKKLDLLEIIKKLEKAHVNEVYQASGEQYGLTEDETETLLRLLEKDGRIRRFNGYVKVNL
ncbi:MAG: hypothetical protein RMJ07_01825 [Nitrososphaerota archaeon]|nr:hypothetical protein [Candidatus Bathyarchaeota archaeon]MDW8048407.1 hypothetical protein [Nitrososphaerota archaeon]